MVRVITQETFDEVVKENIEEFDMTPEDAVKEATAQFQAQGVNLANIIKDLALGENHLVSEIVTDLKELASQGADDKEITVKLEALKTECEKDLARRVRAANDGAYTTLIELLEARWKIYTDSRSEKDERFIVALLKALNSLMDVQPDLLEQKGVDIIKSAVAAAAAPRVQAAALQWAATCCVKHEQNRQTLFNKNIADDLKVLLTDQKNVDLARPALRLARRLTLDDDVRVQAGRAHETARALAERLLAALSALLHEHSAPPLASEIMLTLAAVLVRHELCAAAARAGVLRALLAALAAGCGDAALVQQGYKLITALAGNDDVKREIMSTDLPFIIVTALNQHRSNPTAAALGLKCVSALCLREPAHSELFLERGAAEELVGCMNQHRGDAGVQKNACWAIRNMVARCRDQRDKFLELGAEALLNEAYSNFAEEFGFDIKSALRDLECDVKLDEPWTGKGVQMEY